MTAPPEVTSVLEQALTAIAFLGSGLTLLGLAIVASVHDKSDDQRDDGAA